jgi:hypothetical protein
MTKIKTSFCTVVQNKAGDHLSVEIEATVQPEGTYGTYDSPSLFSAVIDSIWNYLDHKEVPRDSLIPWAETYLEDEAIYHAKGSFL